MQCTVIPLKDAYTKAMARTTGHLKKICFDFTSCIQFQMEMQTISGFGSSSPDGTEFVHFTLLFTDDGKEMYQELTHVHSWYIEMHYMRTFFPVWRHGFFVLRDVHSQRVYL